MTLGDRTWQIDAEGLTIEECRVNAQANDYVSLSLTAADDPNVKEISVESTAVMNGVSIELSDATWNGACDGDDFTIDGWTLTGRAMVESRG